jgi:hypothetical protein
MLGFESDSDSSTDESCAPPPAKAARTSKSNLGKQHCDGITVKPSPSAPSRAAGKKSQSPASSTKPQVSGKKKQLPAPVASPQPTRKKYCVTSSKSTAAEENPASQEMLSEAVCNQNLMVDSKSKVSKALSAKDEKAQGPGNVNAVPSPTPEEKVREDPPTVVVVEKGDTPPPIPTPGGGTTDNVPSPHANSQRVRRGRWNKKILEPLSVSGDMNQVAPPQEDEQLDQTSSGMRGLLTREAVAEPPITRTKCDPGTGELVPTNPPPTVEWFTMKNFQKVGVPYILSSGEVGMWFQDGSCMQLLDDGKSKSILYVNKNHHYFEITASPENFVAVPRKLEKKFFCVLWCRHHLKADKQAAPGSQCKQLVAYPLWKTHAPKGCGGGAPFIASVVMSDAATIPEFHLSNTAEPYPDNTYYVSDDERR